MSREIKFDFIYKGDTGFHHKKYSLSELIAKPLSQLSDLHHQMELVATREFTGLKDKNGVEIYEVDVCKITEEDEDSCCGNEFEYVGYVVWKLGRWGFKDNVIRSLGAADWTRYANLDMWRAEFEVIGNIYENPELLEKTND